MQECVVAVVVVFAGRLFDFKIRFSHVTDSDDTATHCNAMQFNEAHWNPLQLTATHCHNFAPSQTMTHYNTV